MVCIQQDPARLRVHMLAEFTPLVPIQHCGFKNGQIPEWYHIHCATSHAQCQGIFQFDTMNASVANHVTVTTSAEFAIGARSTWCIQLGSSKCHYFICTHGIMEEPTMYMYQSIDIANEPSEQSTVPGLIHIVLLKLD